MIGPRIRASRINGHLSKAQRDRIRVGIRRVPLRARAIRKGGRGPRRRPRCGYAIPAPRSSIRSRSSTARPTCAGSTRPPAGQTSAPRASAKWSTCSRPGSSNGRESNQLPRRTPGRLGVISRSVSGVISELQIIWMRETRAANPGFGIRHHRLARRRPQGRCIRLRPGEQLAVIRGRGPVGSGRPGAGAGAAVRGRQAAARGRRR
jgi:hypothetical protein